MVKKIAPVPIRSWLLPPEEAFLGTSAAMRDVRDKLERIAYTDIPILVRGEAGTGKEILARLIHKRYPGESAPFHKISPAGRAGWRQSASLVPAPGGTGQGHLFSAVPGRPGCIGTLFFDDVAELSPSSQRNLAHLLREDGTGPGSAEFALPLFRMICSTRHDLERKMRCGHFREDLFYSINIVSLHLPPLRARRQDIPCLARHYWACWREELGSDTPKPPGPFLDALQKYRWPGNVRELAGVMKRYVLLGDGERIADELASRTRWVPMLREIPLKTLARREAQEVERKIILKTPRETEWGRRYAARALNTSYRNLLYKAKEAGMPPKNIVVKREKLH